MSFSGVRVENWPAVMAANAGVVRRDAPAAVPMRRPIFAASALRESGATVVAEAAAGGFGAAGAPEVAMAAVLMPRPAAALTVAPITTSLDSFIKRVPPPRRRKYFAPLRKFRDAAWG